jgi:cobalt/nickel transport system ATP-binding protein
VVLPETGSYVFDGEQVTRARLRDQGFAKRFHQRIGLLFQNPDNQLFCPSVREEIAFGPRQMGLPEDEIAARVADCGDLLGIGHLADKAPWNLSEGEKRKVAFASVLSLNPEVLALDEPMNGLDPRTKRFLRDLLLSLREAGKTILCATHDFGYVDGVFEKAVVFSEDHRIVREGAYDEVASDRDFLNANNLL